jgi:acyl-CoA synthetase (AMP-forming)/AMP-acid ligase II
MPCADARPCLVACPSLTFEGETWSPAELAGRASGWRDAVREVAPGDAPVAMVMANRPRSVALLFAVMGLSAPVILLPPHPSGWRSAPPIPAGTRLLLLPEDAGWASQGPALGLAVRALDETAPGSAAKGEVTGTAPGLVLFTSGSTDLPKPVCRPLSRLLAGGRMLVEGAGLPRGASVLGTLPLSRGYGLVHALMTAAAAGGHLTMVDPFEPAPVLECLAAGAYHYWPTTVLAADVLARYPRSPTPPSPGLTAVAGRLPVPTCDRYRTRFGVPLRQTFGTTETGPVSFDARLPAEVREETAGSLLPGVRVAIGDDPEARLPPAQQGRVWVSSPGQMLGYGFPPHLESPGGRGDWLGTSDVGRLDEAGVLALGGRLDECIRTAAGYLVNSADIARALEAYPGVTDCAVVPLMTPRGPVIGVLAQAPEGVTPIDLRRHLARRLVPWSRPRVVEVARELPRLAGGKTDRMRCLAILDDVQRGRAVAEGGGR